MSKPPKGYPNEYGAALNPCGSSWSADLTVTGQIPGHGSFGSKLTHKITRITASVPKDISFSTDEVDELKDKIADRIGWLRTALNGADAMVRLTKKQRASIEWLLIHAEAELAGIGEHFDRWIYRELGPWPLSDGDDMEDYRAPANPGDCGTNAAPNYGLQVDGPGRSTVWCPTGGDFAQRKEDREDIRAHLVDALYHVRCAEFGFYRLLLVSMAIDDLEKLPDFAPPSPPPAPPPKSPFGVFLPPTPAPPTHPPGFGFTPPPEQPGPGFTLPDPDDLPDPEEIPESTEVPEEPTPPKVKAKGKVGLGSLGLPVAAAVAAWFLLKR